MLAKTDGDFMPCVVRKRRNVIKYDYFRKWLAQFTLRPTNPQMYVFYYKMKEMGI